MSGAAFDLLIDNDAIKPFARWIAQKLLSQRHMFLACKTKSKEDAARFSFALFNALANLHLLFPSQQWNYAHLAEVHLNRIVQNVQSALFFFLLFVMWLLLLLLGPLKIRRFNDLHFKS